ncbi:thioredoxin [Thermoleptolyngbya sp. M55_K2018_002]|uniref:thioredoxin n=1 Tax=Thermoleptolyngbya sp. M55_K2018_002 TaxID=2747808 RepID=UPI0019EDB2C1|nr:thioredoxin [Thermoleptolyngbya sp. M55_K2018_002]HIK42102.1 thioredoxin [Thermoleptolyngbya sp. M55_K2018_002]
MAVKKAFGSFQEMIDQSEKPVLVDFYATWCGPCQMMGKILEDVNAQMKSKLRVVKINTEAYPDLASKYQVYALPTLVLFKQGQPVDRIEGVLSAPQLMQRLAAKI